MEFWQLYVHVLWKLHLAVMRRLEQELERFASALEQWLYALDARPDRRGWRAAFADFVAEQEADGFTVEPASKHELETWIATWAGEDPPTAEAEPHPYVVSVTPNVSGPPEPQEKLETAEQRGRRELGEQFFERAIRFRLEAQREAERFNYLNLTPQEKAAFEAYVYEWLWCVELRLPPPLVPMSFFNKRQAYERQSAALGSIEAAPYKSESQLRRENREDMIAHPENLTILQQDELYNERTAETLHEMYMARTRRF